MRPNPEPQRPRQKPNSFVTYFGYLMVVVYLGLGFILIFTDMLAGGFPETQRMMLGGLLLVYALYRAFTVTKTLKKRRDDELD